MLRKPSTDEYPEYYKFYIESLPELGIIDFLEKQTTEVLNLYNNLSKETLLYKYAKNKWSVIEVLAHLLDSEIIMGYRALTFARKDKTNLPLYDHDEYVKTGFFDMMDSELIIKQYSVARESNLLLFKSFRSDMWIEKGITDGKIFTTRTIPYILAGHTLHHFSVLNEKYL